MQERTQPRPRRHRLVLWSLALAGASCAAPGTALQPRDDDFALVEVRLRG